MTTRLHRLWYPGYPQTRVFLPNFWMKIVRPEKGEKLPKNVVRFIVSDQMTKYDVREYLTKIYQAPVRDVRVNIVQGKFLNWSQEEKNFLRPPDEKYPDYKEAYVTFRKDIEFEFPDLFGEFKEEEKKQLKKMEKLKKSKTTRPTGDLNRRGVASWFSL